MEKIQPDNSNINNSVDNDLSSDDNDLPDDMGPPELFKKRSSLFEDCPLQPVFNEKDLKQNKILRHVLKQSLHQLLHEFRSNSYNVNSVYREINKKLASMQVSQQREAVIKIIQEIEVFIWQLSMSPKYWIHMLNNQGIYSSAEEADIDLHMFTSKIYQRVSQESLKMCAYSPLFLDLVSDQVFFLLEQISAQVCQLYQRGKSVIEKEIADVTAIIKKTKLINFYILFQILLDISNKCYELIEVELQEGILAHAQPIFSETFAHYIIEKHEVMNLKNNKKGSKTLMSESQKQQTIIRKIKNSNHVKWREAIREDGQIGILVEIQNAPSKEKKSTEQGVNQNFIVKLDDQGQIDIMGVNSVRLNWKVCEKKSEETDVLSLVKEKKKIVARLRTSPAEISNYTVLSNVSTVGGSLGKCLADIRKYDSASDFMMDLSKGAAIGGSFNYLISHVPLVGYLFITGGYTYSFYNIFSNKYSTSTKKLQQVGNMTIDTASSLGSGLLGAFVGQALIPVPFLGAFVGGVVGGFVGQIGGRSVSNFLENSRFEITIQGIKKTLKVNGYWQADEETLKCIGLKKQKFFAEIPVQLQKRMNCDRLWITLICFTLLTFDESRKRKQFMEKSMKKLAKRQKQIKKGKISIEQYKEQYQYVPDLDLQCISKYLAKQKVQYLACIQELEKFMGKMFSRIK